MAYFDEDVSRRKTLDDDGENRIDSTPIPNLPKSPEVPPILLPTGLTTSIFDPPNLPPGVIWNLAGKTMDGGGDNPVGGGVETGTTPLPNLPKAPETVALGKTVYSPITKGAVTVGAAVPGLNGFIWNSAGGYEPGGAGNRVHGMPGYTYGQDGYSVVPPATGGGATTTATGSTGGTTTTGGKNQYGGSASLDPAVMRQQTIEMWQKRFGTIEMWQKRFGTMPTDAQINEVIKYASVPDKFSDGQVRVGVNPYWIERIGTGSASADPALAGTDTLLSGYTGKLPEGGGYNGAHGFTSGTAGPYNAGLLGFDDPATSQFVSLLSQRINDLMAPLNAPESQTYKAQLQKVLDAINGGGTQQTQDYLSLIKSQIPQLLGPAFSESQLKQLETRAYDTLDRDRQAAIDATVKAMGQRGIPPSSGVVQEAINRVNQQFDIQKQQQRQSLNTYEIGAANERRNQALGLAESGAAVSNTLMLQGVSIAQALDQLGRLVRGEQNQNADKAVTYAGIPVDLTQQRINTALQTLGLSQGQSSSLSSALAQLAQLGANVGQTNSQNNAADWLSIAQLLAGLGKT